MTLLVVIIILTMFFTVILSIAVYQKNTNAICKSKKRLDGKTAVVTGGTSGMGLEIAKDFAHRGARVIVACPFEKEGIFGRKHIIQSSHNEKVDFQYLDLSSFDSVKKFAENILKNETRLDILVNNAGMNNGDWLTKDGLNINMQVNYFGTVLLTLLLLPLLKNTGTSEEPSRIVNTTSICRIIGKFNKERWTQSTKIWISYADSKLCITLFTHELAKRIDSHVIVNAVDPGFVATPITTKMAGVLEPLVKYFICCIFKRPWEGAQSAIFAAVSDKVAQQSGKCFANCKETKLSYGYFDDTMCRSLWEQTMKVLNFDDSDVS